MTVNVSRMTFGFVKVFLSRMDRKAGDGQHGVVWYEGFDERTLGPQCEGLLEFILLDIEVSSVVSLGLLLVSVHVFLSKFGSSQTHVSDPSLIPDVNSYSKSMDF